MPSNKLKKKTKKTTSKPSLEKSDSSIETEESSFSMRLKRVTFTRLEVYEHPYELGDNPSTYGK